MIVWGVVLWRGRSQMRPETFAGILLMAQVLLLETRRQRAVRVPARARSGPGAWCRSRLLWANAHISYYLGFIISRRLPAG
jgi:hypothetical protein